MLYSLPLFLNDPQAKTSWRIASFKRTCSARLSRKHHRSRNPASRFWSFKRLIPMQDLLVVSFSELGRSSESHKKSSSKKFLGSYRRSESSPITRSSTFMLWQIRDVETIDPITSGCIACIGFDSTLNSPCRTPNARSISLRVDSCHLANFFSTLLTGVDIVQTSYASGVGGVDDQLWGRRSSWWLLPICPSTYSRWLFIITVTSATVSSAIASAAFDVAIMAFENMVNIANASFEILGAILLSIQRPTAIEVGKLLFCGGRRVLGNRKDTCRRWLLLLYELMTNPGIRQIRANFACV